MAQLPDGPRGQSAWEAWFDKLRSPSSQTTEDPSQVFLARTGARLPAWTAFLDHLDSLPIELPEFPRISYWVLWWLMVGFVIVVGPVNYTVLKKRGKLPLFIITASGISIVGGAVLLLAAVLLEGFGAKAVSSGVTLLFQQDHRAIAFQRASLYSTVGLSLSFPVDTMTAAMFGKEFREGAGVMPYRYGESKETEGVIDFDNGVTLGGGFVPARLVRAFGSVQQRTERGRLLFAKNTKGELEVQNGLGVGLSGLVYRDADGRHYSARSIAAGASAVLASPVDMQTWESQRKALIASGDASLIPASFDLPVNAYLTLTDEPFGAPPLSRKVKLHPSKHIIVGFIGHE